MQRSRRWIPITLIIVFALGGALGAKGVGGLFKGCAACLRVAAPAIRTAVVLAAIVGRAVALAHHDAHRHSYDCGHARRYYDRRWVYHYQNRWEYEEEGRWYAYSGGGAPSAPAPPTAPPPHAPPPILEGPATAGAPAAQPGPPAMPGLRELLDFLRANAGKPLDDVRPEIERVCGALPEINVAAGCRRHLPNEHHDGEVCAYFCVHHCGVHAPTGVVLADPLPPRVIPADAPVPRLP